MKYSPQKEWPMATYKPAWKLFRRMSDENYVTAEHLVSRSHWPLRKGITLLDVGCGDGMLTERIVLLSKSSVSEVRLLDPDSGFLAEAEGHVSETGLVSRVVRIVGTAEDSVAENAQGVDAILAVHVVYLMEADSFRRLLADLPMQTPLYVVLDTPDSVFFKLWRRTAPKYAERSEKAHQAIKDLPDSFNIDLSTITSHVDSPLNQDQQEMKDAILSLLCYADLSNTTDATRRWIYKQVKNHTVGNAVHCESACYEIVRTHN